MFISVEEIKVMENSRIRMWCDVPFALPTDIEVIWRFAEEVRSAYGESFTFTAILLKVTVQHFCQIHTLAYSS